MKFLLFGILLYRCIVSYGADPKYPVFTIPEELRKDVNVVVREDNMVYTITSRSTASLHVYFVATILNSHGQRFAQRAVGYNKLSKITGIKANVYDALGNLIKKIKPSEIIDRSAFDGFSLYSDNRYKSVDLAHGSFPYTIEFEYKIDYEYLYGIDGTYLVPGEKTSVQHVSYQLNFPTELAPRYKVLNIQAEPVKKTEKGMQSVTWSFENLKPIRLEPYGPDPDKILPRIIAAPGAFEYEGFAGDMSTWENYGKWKALVIKGRNQLPESAKAKVQEITKGMTSQEQKVKALYEYLQNKTRYVSIQEGIGGLQPFEASLVDQVGYGDCKALSNYMVSMLQEVGIKGYYTTVMAGDFEYTIMEDFPSHQSNHVVVAVPNGKDTLWLECTSQTNPFGYAGMFTGDRKAFMVTENGGVWVNTPRYPENQNVQSRSAEVFVDTFGEATARIKTTYSGLQYENDGLNFILNDQYDQQKKWVLRTTEIPTFDVKSFKFENRKDKIPSAVVSLDLNLKKLATVSGKRLMLTPNLMNRSTFIPEKTENRKTEIVRNFCHTDYDTIRFHIPEEIYPEFLPEPVKLKSRFGEYESSYKIDQGLVVYTRKMIVYKGSYPASSYQEFVDFYKSVSKADNSKLVFLNKT
ncbi:MAG TPA: DUF3857 and transglutaminase domain-containing protein [Cyclobacteriaceae bacterium]|nr:DUF3857 and transglutaminase domain-containing protein [Cyclobacteriaceae bacterium]